MRRVARAFAGLGKVVRNENLRRLELAWGASITAEWAHFVALGVFAYEVGGALGVGLVGLLRMLPAAAVAPFAAFLGDRFRRERFLLAVCALAAAALAGSALAFSAGMDAIVFALAGVLAVASTLFRPAHQALLPSLARTPEELVASNGAAATVESFGTLAGPLLAGLAVAATDAGVVFAAGAVAYLASALLAFRLRVEGRVRRASVSAEDVRTGVLGGFGVLARERDPRLVVGLVVAQTFVRGALNVLIVVTVFRLLHAGESSVGFLTAAVGAGGLVGAFGALALQGRRLAVPFGISLVFWGLPIALIAAWPSEAATFLLLAVVGAANSVEDVAAFTLLQRIVREDVLTRVFGILWGLGMGAVAVGSIVTSALVAALGPRGALVAAGALLPLLVLLAWPRLRAIDASAAVPARELAFLDSIPMFAPLSVAAKEHVASNLASISIRAGEVVVTEGDPGECFYIVERGELEVVKNGSRQIARGPGDYFGEIALLRGVPRTATVRALTDSDLFVLDGEDFIAAVTEHSAGRAAGEAVVAERLARLPH